ncbi:MAG: NTP transferase domain-containing protein [Melioribacteraceae bacterium]|nr:NTP transferase domain-containing protein [Melioribacteraceae bacterium]MCF8392976.1 NTP transferase domain-containing protein [Melioribacteraceae bacterium]MCF8417281.1 NTP transferase domain-containing protein [Melioribacteraceae bacterium]
MDIYAVIMAGGVGSRFWPRSRHHKPKQLIRIFGNNTMIQDTVNRLDGIIPKDNILVITNRVQKPRILEQLPQLKEENIIDEPFGKNTAACIGLASVIIESKSKDAVFITLPADHLIKDEKEFQDTIMKAVDFAYESKGLVTIGIKPTRPETGYGYIQRKDSKETDGIYKVNTFAEKPNLGTAKRFITSGDFLWNSGMFIWRVDAIMDEIRKYMPELSEGLKSLSEHLGSHDFQKTLINVYGQLKSVSIDYGVMEKSKMVYVTEGNFDWNDVGSWEAVYLISDKDEDGNAKIGDVYTENTFNSYVFSPRKFAALIGVQNLIVIETSHSLLVCSRDHAQDVKHVVDHLKMNNKTDLL